MNRYFVVQCMYIFIFVSSASLYMYIGDHTIIQEILVLKYLFMCKIFMSDNFCRVKKFTMHSIYLVTVLKV